MNATTESAPERCALCWHTLGLVGLKLSNCRVDLLSVLVEANTRRRQTVTTTLTRPHTNNVSVNGARNTVYHLDVQLGKSVLCQIPTIKYSKDNVTLVKGKKESGINGGGMLTLVDGGFRKITDGSGFDNVTNGESLDSLVLGDSARAVGASHESYVASAGLVAAMITQSRSRGWGACEQICTRGQERVERRTSRKQHDNNCSDAIKVAAETKPRICSQGRDKWDSTVCWR